MKDNMQAPLSTFFQSFPALQESKVDKNDCIEVVNMLSGPSLITSNLFY